MQEKRAYGEETICIASLFTHSNGKSVHNQYFKRYFGIYFGAFNLLSFVGHQLELGTCQSHNLNAFQRHFQLKIANIFMAAITTTNIRNWIRTSDLENLELVVLEGQGQKLLSENASDNRIRQFLKSVPGYIVSFNCNHYHHFTVTKLFSAKN